MDWVPLSTVKTTSFFSKTQNLTSPGNDQIQNYRLKTSAAAHMHITRNFIAIMEEPEKIHHWMAAKMSYLLPKLQNSKEVQLRA